jgi:disulfide oxidoreductase YuzD
VGAELERRYDGAVSISYLDAGDDTVRAEHATVIDEIDKRGLLYPVTVIDGVPVYDGAVSYPAIMRAVQNRLDSVEA